MSPPWSNLRFSAICSVDTPELSAREAWGREGDLLRGDGGVHRVFAGKVHIAAQWSAQWSLDFSGTQKAGVHRGAQAPKICRGCGKGEGLPV